MSLVSALGQLLPFLAAVAYQMVAILKAKFKSSAPKETLAQEQQERLRIGLLSVILCVYPLLTIRGSILSHLREGVMA